MPEILILKVWPLYQGLFTSQISRFPFVQKEGSTVECKLVIFSGRVRSDYCRRCAPVEAPEDAEKKAEAAGEFQLLEGQQTKFLVMH